MPELNLWAAWIGILLGMITGAGMGLLFDREDWMGGYGSWRRRLTRLGHISFFGLAFVNLAFVLTVDRMGAAVGEPPPASVVLASYLLVAGAVLMPATCFLAAWRRGLRLLFVLPVGCLLVGVLSLLVSRLN